MLSLSKEIITMKENETEGTPYQELEMVYSPILGVTYELVDVIEEEEKE